MIKLLDNNRQALHLITQVKDYYIESDLETADKMIHFLLPKTDAAYGDLQQERYLQTEDNVFVIKEVNHKQKDFVEIFGKIDIDGLRSKVIQEYESVEKAAVLVMNEILVGTGWTYQAFDIPAKLRTIRAEDKNAYEIILQAMNVYGLEVDFDALNKKVKIYQRLGTDRGSYVQSDLNLKKVEYQSDTYDLVTRIYAYGNEGLTFASINGGKEYVENFTYTNKIIERVWRDDRYTVKENLLADAQAKLAVSAIPRVSYVADVLQLTKLNPIYSILDYQLGDTVKIMDKDLGIIDYQRVMKLVAYPITPEKNKTHLGNSQLVFKSNEAKLEEQIKQETDKVRTDLMEEIERTNNLIGGPDKGHILVRKDVDDNTYELLILDTPTIETAAKVWRWNINGLGFSNTGYNGDYRVAITNDGRINADFITTGSLSAAMIKTGMLISNNGSSWINMDSGDFNFKNALVWNSTTNKLVLGSNVEISWDYIADAPTIPTSAEDIGARPDTWVPTPGEIGARPDNWVPTATQVGARPNTWTPTAAEVKARPDNWTPTAAQVGALPNTTVIPTTAAQVGARPSNWTPTAAEVGARPIGWMPTATDVGAKLMDWLPSWNEITGKPNIQPLPPFITSTKITATTIESPSISAGTIHSAAITGSTIGGGTIVGSLFKTGVTGRRIEIDSGGLRSIGSNEILDGISISPTENFGRLSLHKHVAAYDSNKTYSRGERATQVIGGITYLYVYINNESSRQPLQSSAYWVRAWSGTIANFTNIEGEVGEIVMNESPYHDPDQVALGIKSYSRNIHLLCEGASDANSGAKIPVSGDVQLTSRHGKVQAAAREGIEFKSEKDLILSTQFEMLYPDSPHSGQGVPPGNIILRPNNKSTDGVGEVRVEGYLNSIIRSSSNSSSHDNGVGLILKAGAAGTGFLYLKTNMVMSDGPFSHNSDIRLKENIKPIDERLLDAADDIDLISFNFKERIKGTQIGVIAQHVESILDENEIDKDDFPVVITTIDPSTEKEVKRVNYDTIMMLKIAALERRITELESKLSEEEI